MNNLKIKKLDNGKFTFFKKNGERINQKEYDNCQFFNNNYVKIYINKKWYFLNKLGETRKI